MPAKPENDEVKSSATKFLDVHPELRRAMKSSSVFEKIKALNELEIDEERFYIVKGDALGNEDELYLDVLARGFSENDAADALTQALFLELKEEHIDLLRKRFGKF